MKRFTIILFLIIHSLSSIAQNKPIYNIKDPGEDKPKRCEEYLTLDRSLPPEVQYSITEHKGVLYLLFSSKQHFNQIFDHKGDGIAIDIIKRSQYPCDEPNQYSESWASKGRLLPPLYKEELLRRGQLDKNNVLVIRYGPLPKELDPKEVEYNLLIVQKNWLCDSRFFFKVDYDTWSLLESGLYRDSLDYKAKYQLGEVQKTLSFTVPFEKDKTVFDEASVKPIYDTLNLTDYFIKKIVIDAYSSVEGPLDRNIRLQEGRAQSMVDALKSYQNQSIFSEINAQENWKEFRRDVRGSDFDYMADMDKESVKAKLAGNKPLLETIEPILNKHRKAILTVALEKRINPETISAKAIQSLFDQSIATENLAEALYLQQVVFKRIGKKDLPESLIDELTIPKSNKFFTLLNNNALFVTNLHPKDLNKGIAAFEKLLSALPDNQKLRYNLTTLKMKQWAVNEQFTTRAEVLDLINKLERGRLTPSLLRTLKINYDIVLTKYLNDERDYVAKNKSLRNLYNTYRREALNDSDLLRLAKYMAYYSRFDWAHTLLKMRVLDTEASTDLIFYYLNLTITDPKKTRRREYQSIIDRAIAQDKKRFCDLFKAKSQGGITFQLLDDNNLKPTYCAVCNDG